MAEQPRANSPQFDDVRASTAAPSVDQSAREKGGLVGAQLAKTISQRIQVHTPNENPKHVANPALLHPKAARRFLKSQTLARLPEENWISEASA